MVKLPVDGSHEAIFCNIGFEFLPFAEGETWRDTKLPAGWELIKIGNHEYHIIDDKKRQRAMVLTSTIPMLRPVRRFVHGIDEFDPNRDVNVRFCVWDLSLPGERKNQVVFDINFGVPNRITSGKAHNSVVEKYKKLRHCEKWLQDRYPNWEDPNYYWD